MASRELAVVPRLQAGTYSALRVLRFVRSLIAAEPKRLRMSKWLTAWRKPSSSSDECGIELPKCGTVACVGGWINIVTGHKESNRKSSSPNVSRPGERALQHLGLIDDVKDFCGDYQLRNAARDIDDLFGWTQLRGAQVVKRLDRIIAKHKNELQRAVVKVAAPRR